MSTSSDKDAVSHWKEKYLRQAENFDEEVKSFEEFNEILKRLLVRVSLSAEGVDQKLDDELDMLRRAVRNAPVSEHGLEKRLESLEDLVLKLDKRKQQSSENALEALNRLIEQLMGLDVGMSRKRELKKLSKSLGERVNRFSEYPSILKLYGDIQSRILAEKFGGEKSEGFFSRLMGGARATRDVDSAKTAKESSIKEESSTGQAPSVYENVSGSSANKESYEQEDESAHNLELGTESEVNEGSSGSKFDSAAPGYGTISTHVSISLNRLIDQLPVPPSAENEVQRIKGDVSKGLNWYELGPTLDDVANLVISAVSVGQKEFESFLQALDGKLAKVQSFLLDNQSQQDNWREVSGEFDRSVRERVQFMSRDVTAATDLSQLKASINDHLDLITSKMDEYAEAEDKRQRESNAQIEVLRSRLEAVEAEAGAVRVKLREERNRAMTDSLTELPNREAFDERMEMEYERWKRYGQPASLVVADIDHFKNVNDTYGHLAGDKALQIIAKELRKRMRKTDFIGRYGGEEFVMILPETAPEVAKEVLEKARQTICRMPFHFKNEDVQISLSFGLAPFLEGKSAADIFEMADQALYRAKNNGRNRVEMFAG